MDALSATTQEKNRKTAAVERALDRARDWYERVTGALGIARKQKKTLLILELEPELTNARDALTLAGREYEVTCGVPAPLSTGPAVKPGTVNALRAANSEFCAIDDEVARCEHQINLLAPQISPLEERLAKAQANPFPIDTGRMVVAGHTAQVAKLQNIAQIAKELASLRDQFEKVRTECKAATEKRNAMLDEELFAKSEAAH